MNEEQERLKNEVKIENKEEVKTEETKMEEVKMEEVKNEEVKLEGVKENGENEKKDNIDVQNNMKIEKEENTALNSNDNEKIDNSKEMTKKVSEIKNHIEEEEREKTITNDFHEIKYTTNEILLKMEQKFSEYLRQFNKEWENEENPKISFVWYD